MPCDKTAITSFTIVTFLTITSHSFAIPLPPVNNTGVELQPKTATRFSSASVPDSGTDPCLIPCSVFNPCEPWQRCVYDNGEDVTGFDRGHCKCPTNSWGVTTDCNGTNKTLTCVVITVRGDACDHDFDCPGDLRCIPSATYPYEKSCEPKRVRLDESCVDSAQCPSNSFCSRQTCICSSPYRAIRKECVIFPRHDDDSNAVQIYRITLIFASCCLALVLIMFLVCIVRKTYWPPSRSERQIHRRRRSSSSMQIAVAEVGAGIPFNVRPPYEKPPSYEESQRNMISMMGTPPPEYPQQLLPIFVEVPLAGRENETSDAGASRPESEVQVHSENSNQESGIRNQAFQPD